MIARTVSVMLLAVFLPVTAPADAGHSLKGIASVYDYDGEVTANGETAKPDDFTAVHKSLPIGTLVKVTSLDTGKSVVVRITDRSPFVNGSVIDLTPRAAAEIGSQGLAAVQLTIVG